MRILPAFTRKVTITATKVWMTIMALSIKCTSSMFFLCQFSTLLDFLMLILAKLWNFHTHMIINIFGCVPYGGGGFGGELCPNDPNKYYERLVCSNSPPFIALLSVNLEPFGGQPPHCPPPNTYMHDAWILKGLPTLKWLILYTMSTF